MPDFRRTALNQRAIIINVIREVPVEFRVGRMIKAERKQEYYQALIDKKTEYEGLRHFWLHFVLVNGAALFPILTTSQKLSRWPDA